MPPKTAIYTAIFGNYDGLKAQAPQHPDVDFFCFTDHQPQDAKGWTIIPVPVEDNPRQQAKFFKLLPHKLPQLGNYDHTIWIDGSMAITRPDFAIWALSHIKKSGWAMAAHPEMSCLYDEAAAMAATKKYQHTPIAEQAAHYRAQHCPPQSGLYMAGLIARDMRNPQWQNLCDKWWEENLRWTLRDQISLPYILWREKGTLDVIPGDITQSPYLAIDNAHRIHEYQPPA